jgi:Rrf2 family protein
MNMKISTKGRYALEAVVDLSYHAKDELESLKSIAKRLNKSKNYLEQLFVLLRQNNIVVSIRGSQGGYKLAKEASKITAGDVVRAVEGSLAPVACLDFSNKEQCCGDYEKCVTRVVWKKMMDEISNVLDDVTIQDLKDCYEKMNKENIIEYYI